jgi:hypothetical protein
MKDHRERRIVARRNRRSWRRFGGLSVLELIIGVLAILIVVIFLLQHLGRA